MLSELIPSMHLLCTVFMTGLIWFVQIVHYPLFACIGREEFAGYERRHQVLTTWIVGPVMCLELATGIVWLLSGTADVHFRHLCNCALLATIWLSTALLQMPAHRALLAHIHQNGLPRAEV